MFSSKVLLQGLHVCSWLSGGQSNRRIQQPHSGQCCKWAGETKPTNLMLRVNAQAMQHLENSNAQTLACAVLSSDNSLGMSSMACPEPALTTQVALHAASDSSAAAAVGPLCFASGRLRWKASACCRASCQWSAADMHSSRSRLILT